jgi:uncharacterized membrane protein YedE/YeeE
MSLSSLEAGASGSSRGASAAWSSPRSAAAVAVAALVVAGAFVLSAVRDGDQSPAVSLLIGAALGLAFERGRFCFFCIFRDAFEHRNTRPLLSILTAIAVGAIGHAVVFGLYLPNPRGEGLPPLAHISPVSLPLVAGAFAFGIGMALSGACISGHLYRLGQGDLRGIPALAGSLVGFGLGFVTWNTLYLRFVTESPTWWLRRGAGRDADRDGRAGGVHGARQPRRSRSVGACGGTVTWVAPRRVGATGVPALVAGRDGRGGRHDWHRCLPADCAARRHVAVEHGVAHVPRRPRRTA